MSGDRCTCGHPAARHALHADDHPCRICRCEVYANANPAPVYPYRPEGRSDPAVTAMHAERTALISQVPGRRIA